MIPTESSLKLTTRTQLVYAVVDAARELMHAHPKATDYGVLVTATKAALMDLDAYDRKLALPLDGRKERGR
jgi:hypothetical protein